LAKGRFSTATTGGTGTCSANGRNLAWTAGVGNGGQRLLIVPELELAVVFTAGAYGERSEQLGRTEFALFRQIVAAA
jgi:CubicO group peptidase (beta-lactamase class C family)